MMYCTTVLLLFPVLSGCQCWQKQNQRGPGHLQGGRPRPGSQVHSVRAVRRPRRQRHLHEGRHGAAPHHPPELGGDAAAHRGGLGSSQGNTALICRLRVVTPSCAQSGAASGDNLSQLSLDYEELMQQPHEPSVLDLVAGALESAFWVMDSVILNDKLEYKITGGWRHLLCTSSDPAPAGGSTCLVALFICDRIFVANAGDSRAVLFRFLEKPR